MLEHKINFMAVGYKIKQLRKKQGLTQEQLAEQISVSSKYISAIENGKQVSLSTLLNLADALDVTLDYFLVGVIKRQPIEQINEYLQQCSLDDLPIIERIVKIYAEKNMEAEHYKFTDNK